MKKERPFGRCTKCGHYSTNIEMINNRCPLRFLKNKKSIGCKGVYRSLLSKGDLKECSNCLAEEINCKECNNIGWI